MFSRKLISIAVSWCTWSSLTSLAAAGPPALTTLSDAWVQYRVPEKAYVILKRADVEAVVVDNRGVQDECAARSSTAVERNCEPEAPPAISW